MRLCYFFPVLLALTGCLAGGSDTGGEGGGDAGPACSAPEAGPGCGPCSAGLAGQVQGMCKASALLLDAVGFCACQGACAADCTVYGEKPGPACDWRDGANGTCQACLRVSCAYQVASCEEDR